MRRSAERGFTLIEVMAVVALLAVLLVVALPRDEGTRPLKVELAASRHYEISIEVSEESLRRHGLTFDRMTRAVRGSC